MHTQESFLEMPDPDDGEIKVVFMSLTHDRLLEHGKLLGGLHGRLP